MSTDLEARLSEDDIKNHLVYDILYDYELSNSAIDELYAFITKLIADREREARVKYERRGMAFVHATVIELSNDRKMLKSLDGIVQERLAVLRKDGD